ncbi:transposase [Streptomyces sp. NPDC127044]
MIDKESGEMAAGTFRTIFTQPTADLVRTQPDTVANRLERINREIKRRTDVVQAFPNQLREQQLQGETGPLTVAGSSCAASPHEPPSQDCCGGDQTGEMSGPCDVKAARCRG